MPLKLTGLWRHADFLRLWSGQTLSVFGSMIGVTAMTFTATLFFHATPFQMGVLNALQLRQHSWAACSPEPEWIACGADPCSSRQTWAEPWC